MSTGRTLRRAAVAVVATVALGGCWPAPGQGADLSGFNPWEARLTVDNVDTLVPVWSTTAPGIASPVGVVSSEGVVVVTGYHDTAALDIVTGGVLWSTGAPTASDRRDGASLLPPTPWNLPSIIADGQVNQVWQSAFRRTDQYDLRTGALEGSAAGYVAIRGDRRLVEDTDLATSEVFIRVEDVTDPAATWGGVIWDLDATYNGPDTSLGVERVYAAGTGLASAVPGDARTAEPGVRAFAPDAPATCGPADRPVYACPVWVAPIAGAWSASPPVMGPGEATIYVVTAAGGVYALDAGTGAVRWNATVAPARSPDPYPPALADGSLYVPTASGMSVFAADGCGASECEASWVAADTGAPTRGQPSVAGGVVYTATAGPTGTVRAYDAHGCGATACEPLWSVDTGREVYVSPVPVQGRLLVATRDGAVTAFAPTAPPSS